MLMQKTNNKQTGYTQNKKHQGGCEEIVRSLSLQLPSNKIGPDDKFIIINKAIKKQQQKIIERDELM